MASLIKVSEWYRRASAPTISKKAFQIAGPVERTKKIFYIATMVLKPVSVDSPDVLELIQQLNEHHLSLCPPEICHLATPSDLKKIKCAMLGAFDGQILCGIGGVKFCEDYGEITRMFVAPQYRNRGISSLILDELMALVRAGGYRLVRLETSEKFETAVKLYSNKGFQFCMPFGEYTLALFNTYMEKTL